MHMTTKSTQNVRIALIGFALLAVVIGAFASVSVANAYTTGAGGDGCCGGDYGGGMTGGDGQSGGGPYDWSWPTAPSCTINANPTSVSYNGATTVSWTSYNATSASLSSVGSVALNGSRAFNNLTATRTFVLTVYDAHGRSGTCQRTVTVSQQPQVPSCTLSANPNSVSYNGSSTLTWTSNNATSASIDNGVGSVAVNGSYGVSGLTSSRTYTMTVNGTGGTATCQATVTVNQQSLPSCSISANPSIVQYGGSSTLNWSSNNATSATIDSIGSVATNGSYYLSNITGSRTYTMTVYGNGGTATCQTTVSTTQYQNQPSCTISANPTYLQNGGSTYLTWNSYNASSASIDSIGSVNLSGGQSVYPGYSRTYTMTVYGNGGTATCQTSVTVGTIYNNQEPSCSIWVNPNTVQYGGTATINWSSNNSYSAFLSNVGVVSTSGSRSVNVYGNQTYTLTVYGQNGTTRTCSASVNSTTYYNPPVYNPPIATPVRVSLTAIPYTGLGDLSGTMLAWYGMIAAAGVALYATYLFRGTLVPAWAQMFGFAPATARRPMARVQATIKHDVDSVKRILNRTRRA